MGNLFLTAQLDTPDPTDSVPVVSALYFTGENSTLLAIYRFQRNLRKPSPTELIIVLFQAPILDST